RGALPAVAVHADRGGLVGGEGRAGARAAASPPGRRAARHLARVAHGAAGRGGAAGRLSRGGAAVPPHDGPGGPCPTSWPRMCAAPGPRPLSRVDGPRGGRIRPTLLQSRTTLASL